MKRPRKPVSRIAGQVAEPSEHLSQVRLLKLLVYMMRPELRVLAIPNQGKRSMRSGNRMRAEGMVAGAPDLLFLFPVSEGAVAWLEMKTQKGALAINQIAFKAHCDRLGHRWALARSVDEALDVLRGWKALRSNVEVI